MGLTIAVVDAATVSDLVRSLLATEPHRSHLAMLSHQPPLHQDTAPRLQPVAVDSTSTCVVVPALVEVPGLPLAAQPVPDTQPPIRRQQVSHCT